MERYFDKAAASFGYRLVLNPKQADASCIWYEDQTKWMVFISNEFQRISFDKLREIAEIIAECFKSEAIADVLDEPPGNFEHQFYFSKTANAFDEPPFLATGATVLKSGGPLSCNPDEPFVLSAQNYGGISKGIQISFLFTDSEIKKIELYEPAIWLYKDYKSNGRYNIPLAQEKLVLNENEYKTIDLPDFIFPEGINVYSNKLMAKKKQDEQYYRSFGLRFIPKCNIYLLKDFKINLLPTEYPANGTSWGKHDVIKLMRNLIPIEAMTGLLRPQNETQGLL